MDYLYEKIAGKGPARKYNLEKCRKELERSCANYQNRGNRFPPTPRTTPYTSSAPTVQPQHSPQRKYVRFQTAQSLNESAHVPQKVKRYPFEYNEDELRQRAQQIRGGSKQESQPRPHQPPVSTSDPLDGYSGHNFSNNDSNNDRNAESYAPRRQPTLHRQDLTQDDVATIRATAERIASHCAVRDKQPYPNSPRQGTLHRTKSTSGLEKIGTEGQKSAKQTQDDNGISVTEDGCIIQRGFDFSPMASSPADNVHVRFDSVFDLRHTTPNEKSRKEPFRPSVRNKRGTRVPVCFRKQEIPHQRNISHLSALLSGQFPPPDGSETQRTAQERKPHQADLPYQCPQMPIPARTSVFFSGSSSSDAVVSESEDDDEEQTICGSENVDSVTSSAVCADGSKDVTSPGSVATLVNSDKLAKSVKTSDRLPQHSAPPSPLSSSKRPAPNPPQVKQNRLPHAGTPLPQRLSKHPESTFDARAQDPGRLPHYQRRNPQPQFLRSQQTARILLAHQQYRRAQKPPSPRARSPCQALGLRLPLPPNYGEHNYVSALNEKIDRNGGRRSANFSWDHVAPMHGFSSCPAFNVLD